MNSISEPRLTESCITGIYHRILGEVSAILPVASWAHPPVGMKWTTMKRVYGRALEDGTIEINRIFIGSNARNHLEIVIRHECAHLAAGISYKHGKLFRRMERIFGVGDRYACTEEMRELARRRPYKFTLIAYLENGSCHYIDVHRKSKRCLQYGMTKSTYYVKGVRVVRFEYVDYYKR